MAKNKLRKYAEYESFPNCFDATCNLKGRWKSDFFKNDHPLILELACGKGDYTVNLAKLYPQHNFLGVDRKGSRMWRGAKTALDDDIQNMAFLRIMIETLDQYFEHHEVDEIWITFPDPQPREGKSKKRLTSSRFIKMYRSILPENGIIHLKTDSDLLYDFTLETAAEEGLEIFEQHPNIYSWPDRPDVLNIKTFYENIWLSEGKTIKYIRFSPNKKEIRR